MGNGFRWDKEKNKKLIHERGISFEVIVSNIEGGNVVAVAAGKGKFGHQSMTVPDMNLLNFSDWKKWCLA